MSDSATPWTIAYQASPSMVFSKQEYWSGLPFPSPGDLPNPGIKPRSPALRADALPSRPPNKMQQNFVWLSRQGLGTLQLQDLLSWNLTAMDRSLGYLARKDTEHFSWQPQRTLECPWGHLRAAKAPDCIREFGGGQQMFQFQNYWQRNDPSLKALILGMFCSQE